MSLKSALIFILLAAAAVIAAVFIMHYAYPPVRNITQPLITFLTETAPAYVMQGYKWILGTAAMITPFAVGAYSYYKQAQQVKAAAQTQISNVTSQVTQLTDKATNLESTLASKEATITDLQAKLTAATATPPQDDQLLSSLKSQVTTLEGKCQGLIEGHNSFVKGMIQAANNTLVTDPLTGITYNCIKPPPEIQVR